MICLCKRRTTSRATLIVVLLLQLCRATLVTDGESGPYVLAVLPYVVNFEQLNFLVTLVSRGPFTVVMD